MLETLTLSLFSLYLSPVLLFALAIPYAILRVRDARAERHDPQLGLRVGLYFFYSLGIILVLSGLNVVLLDLVTENQLGRPAFGPPGGVRLEPTDKWFSPIQRTGWGIASGGLVLVVLHLAMIKLLTDEKAFPDVRRTFVGWRFAIAGVVIAITLTSLATILFQKDFGDTQARKALTSILIVWAPIWLIHFSLLRHRGWFIQRAEAGTAGQS